MIRIDEEDHVCRPKLITDDRVSPVHATSKHSNDSINARQDRSKHAITPRTTSLPPQHSPPSTLENEPKQRRRYASDSTSAPNKGTATALVTSFLQYLRHELKTTASEKRNDYHRHRRKKSSEPIKSLSKTMATSPANDGLPETAEKNEILTLIDLLVLRVECLTNEKKHKAADDIHPTVAEVDQNLIEYLYYLFTKFLQEENDPSNEQEISVIDKSNFVHVCQTLVRSGCFDLSAPTVPNSPEQSSADATSSSDPTLTEQLVMREYDLEADDKSVDNELSSLRTVDDQDTWLVVDLAGSQSEDDIPTSDTMKINTLPTTIQMDTTNPEQTVELPTNDDSSSVNILPDKSHDDGQQPVVIASETICLSDNDDEDVTMKGKQGLLLATAGRQLETISNNIQHVWSNDQLTNDENNFNRTPTSNPPAVSDSSISPSSSSSASISPSAPSTITTNENKPIEPLPNEEKEKDEEQRCDEHYTIDDGEKEKNNSNFIQDDYHAPGIILIKVRFTYHLTGETRILAEL